ncbi:MAG TPA: SDR family NAD(P)-dependent oxidoreductase [Longimicrobiaceae bacterium]|nr:SDR family NAD(P)-dependent oxidoreductase [Longimicrobiaceae bacterium]
MAAEGAYLAGKHAVVTGGGRGIGAAVADELARLGAALTLMGRDRGRLEAQARDLAARRGVEAAAVACDVADEGSVAAAFAESRERLGDPHVLVNNAGQSEGVAFGETTRELWDRMLAVNLTGVFLCTRQVLPAMLEARSGRVVNVASTAGLRGYSRTAAYTAAKHGVIGLTRALALETAKRGVTVNAVCPGYTDTDMAQGAVDTLVRARGITPEDARAMIARPIPRGTLILPEEVANAVGWLCSPGASAVTGQAVVVAAGEVMAG